MRDVGQLLARDFFCATHWDDLNHYAQLTVASRHLLDFDVPPGLHLALSHRPTRSFASSLALSALVPAQAGSYPPSPAPVLGPPPSPLLAGQLTYVFSSAQLGLNTTKRTAPRLDRVRFKRVVQGFHVGPLPVRPELRDEAQPTWLAGERVDKSDYLLYGRLYAPSPRLDALYIHRLSRTVQSIVSLISVPAPISAPPLSWQPNDDSAAAAAAASSPSGTAGRLSELELKLLHDTGRWSTEYSYAVGDGMWGARGLYNFGKSGSGEPVEPVASSEPRERVVDEEEEMSTGLRGRWSAGGEVYFSAQERSAGVSTGVRFSTLPEPTAATGGAPSQPATTITATLNPIMGQLSTAYCVATSPDSALASRFDFNLYSYDADLTVGGEWYQRRGKRDDAPEPQPAIESFDAFGRGASADPAPAIKLPTRGIEEGEVTGVLKARASTNAVELLSFPHSCWARTESEPFLSLVVQDIALMWEGRLGDFLVSLGVVADLRLASRSGGRTSPIRSVGIGIQYWS